MEPGNLSKVPSNIWPPVDAEALGKLMTEAEEMFDKNVAPMSPALWAPKLHEVLQDPKIQPLVYGGKGVGSHGDGSVQFLARNKEAQQQLIDYLNAEGMRAYPLTLHPVHTVRKAIIPVAGFGTRLYPATRALKKDFFPIPCPDGLSLLTTNPFCCSWVIPFTARCLISPVPCR